MTNDAGAEGGADGASPDAIASADQPDPPQSPGAAPASARSAAHARTVLEYLVKAVVEDPDGVRVELTEGRRHDISLDVRVSDGDMGRVIGKRGRVAQSIRTVVRAAAVRDEVTVDIEFLE